MKEELLNAKCPYCENSDIKSNGHTKNGRQRYYCNTCRKTFTDLNRYKISKKAKCTLGILYNLLKNNFYDASSLYQALYNACKEEKEMNIENFEFDGNIGNHDGYANNLKYFCRNPKLLICVDEEKIKLIKIHPISKPQKRPRSIVIHENISE